MSSIIETLKNENIPPFRKIYKIKSSGCPIICPLLRISIPIIAGLLYLSASSSTYIKRLFIYIYNASQGLKDEIKESGILFCLKINLK